MAKGITGKADREWSRVIRQVGECERCLAPGIPGKTGWKNLEAHHIIHRGDRDYRWDTSNGVCLCHNCHKWSPWAVHNDASGFRDWLQINREGQWK